MSMVVEVNSQELSAALMRAPEKVLEGARSWVQTVSLSTEAAAKRRLGAEVSEGASGWTINHIRTLSSGGGLSATVKPTNKYAQYVITGRGPGKMPPWGSGTALNAWAERMGMNSFLVARAIARNGSKGHPFMAEAYDDVKEGADLEADKVLASIVESI